MADPTTFPTTFRDLHSDLTMAAEGVLSRRPCAIMLVCTINHARSIGAIPAGVWTSCNMPELAAQVLSDLGGVL
jgi:hypothetical protein